MTIKLLQYFLGIDSQRQRFNPNSWFTDLPTDCARRYTRLASLAMSHEFDRKLVISSSGSWSRETPVHMSTQLQHVSLPSQRSAAEFLGPSAAIETLRETDRERWPSRVGQPSVSAAQRSRGSMDDNCGSLLLLTPSPRSTVQ